MTDESIRVTRQQVLDASRGMLQMQFYMVYSVPTAGMGPVMKNLPAHLEHQCAMERDGIMLAAGPHWNDDETTWDGEGTFVIRAESLTHARQIAAADPMHVAGARAFKVRPWLINEGSLTVRVSFSDRKYELS